LPVSDGILAKAVSTNGTDPVDEQAIFQVDLVKIL
jgi:hypothetical protein